MTDPPDTSHAVSQLPTPSPTSQHLPHLPTSSPTSPHFPPHPFTLSSTSPHLPPHPHTIPYLLTPSLTSSHLSHTSQLLTALIPIVPPHTIPYLSTPSLYTSPTSPYLLLPISSSSPSFPAFVMTVARRGCMRAWEWQRGGANDPLRLFAMARCAAVTFSARMPVAVKGMRVSQEAAELPCLGLLPVATLRNFR